MSDTEQTDRLRELEIENERLRRLLDQRGMSSVLRHQVRNSLGLMRAILRRSMESKSTVDDFAAHLEGRFDALLRVQTTLISSQDGRVDLCTLASDELVASTIQEGELVTIEGPELRIVARRAELLGLVVHELVINALKFGAFAAPGGRLDLSWRIERTPPCLVLNWRESGCRDVEATPTVRGFGTEAIEGMLPYQLKAKSTLQFLPEGLFCTIELPLDP